MREIINVFREFAGLEGMFRFLGHTLQQPIRFFADDKAGTVLARVTPNQLHSGFPGVVHGGLQATLLDEVAFWAVWDKTAKLGFTADIYVRYRRAVAVDQELTIRGVVTRQDGPLVTVAADLFDLAENNCTHATIRYYLAPRSVWEQQYGPLPFADSCFEPPGFRVQR